MAAGVGGGLTALGCCWSGAQGGGWGWRSRAGNQIDMLLVSESMVLVNLAGPTPHPAQCAAHGRGNHGDSRDTAIPHSSTSAEVEGLLASHSRTDPEGAAQSNYAVRE